MKKFLLILLLIFAPVFALAAPGWQRNLTVEWEYTPPGDMPHTGFKLYQDGAAVCTWATAIVRIGSCDVTLVNKSTTFTLTATFADGEESSHSAPYVLNDWGPKPNIISLEATFLQK